MGYNFNLPIIWDYRTMVGTDKSWIDLVNIVSIKYNLSLNLIFAFIMFVVILYSTSDVISDYEFELTHHTQDEVGSSIRYQVSWNMYLI